MSSSMRRPSDRALDAVGKRTLPDAKRLAACRARIDAALVAELQQVDALLTSGKRAEARQLLRKIDAHYAQPKLILASRLVRESARASASSSVMRSSL